MPKYNHTEIEKKYKDLWFKNNIYKAIDFSNKPKKYILAELPYPSGRFLHIGHMMRYTVPEIYSRFLRMRGYNVLFPMGWDCFGLPAETYAQKEGITPQEAISHATVDYKQSMMDMGYSIDWDREINTSEPSYYKWTQWMFLKLWEKGLAKQQEMPVWWCKELGVLADEEVLPAKDGVGRISERGGYKVDKVTFKQWVLDIPAYADRLIQDLQLVNYEDSVKQGQINWIGKKEGAEINFLINGKSVTVFTTRPDTIFGVTFLAISPEHSLIPDLISSAQNIDELNQYIEKAKNLSDLEKQTKEKTGVMIKNVYATNPLDTSNNKIPVFIADYILSDYGTGVVMGVPAHDERDYEFANKYDLPIIEVIQSSEKLYTGDGKIINSGEYNGMQSQEFKELVITTLQKHGKAKNSVFYKLRPQVFSRQRYWGEPIPLIYKKDGSVEAVPQNKLPVELPAMDDFLAGEDGISPLEKNSKWKITTDSDGNEAERETDTMPTWAGSNWYYLRYIDPKNTKIFADFEKLKYWLPVDMYFGDSGHTTAHLLYTRFWVKALYDQGYIPVSEPIMYRMSGGILLGADGHKMSKSRGNTLNPRDELDKNGADAVRTYLAFIGPYEDTYPWNPNSLNACAKLVSSIHFLSSKVNDANSNADIDKKLSHLIKNVTDMMGKLKMNTSVSEIMIFVNYLRKLDAIPLDVWKQFVKVIAPIMPFIAEELWQTANGYDAWKDEHSIHLQSWPEFDEKLLVESSIIIPVQINGKIRTEITVTSDSTEDDVKNILSNEEKYLSFTENKTITKFLYVKNKIVSVIVA